MHRKSQYPYLGAFLVDSTRKPQNAHNLETEQRHVYTRDLA
jgi:hypothetical protein